MSGTKKFNKVVAVVGPTGSGKTEWAKILAAKFSGKVISVDSRQIYKGMDIGTAKDKSFPQALIDIVEPSAKFTLSDYQKQANDLINQYLQMKTLPILAGGTGLYLDAVIYGYVIPKLNGLHAESLKLRKKLEKLSDEELIKKLKEIDPESAQKIDSKNIRRVIRALEVSTLSKLPFSRQQKKQKPKFKTLILGIDVPRETLYAKIDARVEQMIKEGLVEEARKLFERYPADLPALNTIGYKEIIDYFRGRMDLKEAKEKIKLNTHDYVRRQDTWFRRNKDIKWVKTLTEAEKLVQKFLG